MLTKKDREEIAERFRDYDTAEYMTLYSGMYAGLLGEQVPQKTTVKKDRMELANRIIELCDTSNMLELPVDKDGEYIRIGDTVYDEEATEYKAVGYSTHSAGTNIIVEYGKNFGFRTQIFSDELTHKQPVTVKSLAQRVRGVLDGICNTEYAVEELSDIAMQLERLGDNDE